MSVLAVTGLKREAAVVASSRVTAVVGGGDEAALRMRLEEAAADTRVVVSVGIGGGLSPAARVGDWVVADRVLDGPDAFPTDANLNGRLLGSLEAARAAFHLGSIAGGGAILVTAAEKAALFARTGALAVDMESHVAARFAASHELPFAALRVISDAAHHALPGAVAVSMKKDGGLDLPAILLSILKNPRQLPALIRTGREAEVAFAQLKLLGRDDLLGRLGIGDADFG